MQRMAGQSILWEEVFDALDDLIFVIRPDYSIEKVNKKAKDFLGLDTLNLPQKKCYQLIFNEEEPCLFCQKKYISEDSKSCSVDMPISIKDRFFRLKMHSIPNSKGESAQFIDFLHDVTSEIKDQQKLKSTEEQYRLLAENSSDVILLVNKELEFNYISPSAESFTGFTTDELLKLKMETLLTPDSYQRVLSLYEGGKKNGKITAEYQIIKKDKSLCWVEIAITQLRDSSGQVTGYVAHSRDVNDKKVALDALKISEEKYRLIQDNTEIQILYYTLEGRIAFLNRASANSLGGNPDDFTGKHFRELFDSENINLYNKRFSETLNSSAAIEYEDEYHSENGKQIFQSTVSVIKDPEGNAKGILVIVNDITALKQAENKIKRNENRLKSLLTISQMDNLSVSEILDHTLEEALKFTQSKIGFLFHYNEEKKVFKLSGWSKSVANNCMVSEEKTLHELDRLGLWAEPIRQRKPIFINDYQENTSVKKSLPIGHSKLNRYLSVPIFWNKQIVALIGVANKEDDYSQDDINQLQLLMNTVWKIIERNKAENELIIAKEKAEESDRLKSSFLSNMSHEIRTPINGIMGFLSIIKEENLNPKVRNKYFKLVENNFTHLMTLISDIVDISKLESNQISIVNSDVNTLELIEEVIDLANSEYKYAARNVDITIESPPVSDISQIIQTDKVRLRQVLINLVNNALKFTQEGEVKIGYKLQPNGKFVEFFVHDTGIGINENQRQLIFERFRQADETLTRKYGGAGLGLSISKHLIELMGGKIWVESETNEYSTFYFTIPYIPSEQKQPELKPAPRKLEQRNWEEKTFLIVEDDDSNFLYLREILKSSRVQLLRSSSCKETLELLNTTHYHIDLILLDIRLPDGDGTKLISEMRNRFNNIPIIAQTAFALENDRNIYLNAGCNDYISKPINDQLLIKIINQQLNLIEDKNTTMDSEMELMQK